MRRPRISVFEAIGSGWTGSGGTMVGVIVRRDARTRSWTFVGLTVVVVILAAISPNEMVDGDSALTLISAQALLEHGSLDLSPYAGDPRFRFDLESDHRVREHNGGHYNFVLGPPIAMVPAVWLARRFGFDMMEPEDDYLIQNLISALLCGLVFGLTVMVVRSLAPAAGALLIASVFFFGSPLMSTLATALWSQTVALPLMLAAVLATLRCDPDAGVNGRFTGPRLLLIPPLLIAAFFCRPTAGFLALGVLAWFAWRLSIVLRGPGDDGGGTSIPREWGGRLLEWGRTHREFVVAGVVGGALLAVFAALMLGSLLPDYYRPSRLWPRRSPLFGLYAVMLSPSRGLLIFCPFLVVVAAGVVVAGRRIERRPMLLLAAVWAAGHLAALSVRTMWWGGHSFGPRLAAEVVIAAVIPAAIVWNTLTRDSPQRTNAAMVLAIAFLAAGGIAIGIHAGQGLFNPSVQRWNYLPNIDTHPRLLLSWRWPQFLATDEQIRAREYALQLRRLETYAWGDRIGPAGPAAAFSGWYGPTGDRCWSRGHTAGLDIRLPQTTPGEQVRLTLRASGLGPQRVTVRVNGTVVGVMDLDRTPANHHLQLPATKLRFGEINSLVFEIPDARAPDNGDPRILGVNYRWIRLDPILP